MHVRTIGLLFTLSEVGLAKEKIFLPGYTRLLFRTMRLLTGLKHNLWYWGTPFLQGMPTWYYRNLCTCTFQLRSLAVGRDLHEHASFLELQPALRKISVTYPHTVF
ncbi:hypothetical protein CALCODRAFT_491579, partial [Calocera cornea HHB12733]